MGGQVSVASVTSREVGRDSLGERKKKKARHGEKAMLCFFFRFGWFI